MSIVRGIDAIRLDLEMAEKEMAENDLEACRDELRRLEAENARLREIEAAAIAYRDAVVSDWTGDDMQRRVEDIGAAYDALKYLIDYEKQETEK